MVRVRVSPIINAQNELDNWWLQHLDKYTHHYEGLYMFIDERRKQQYQAEYAEQINNITTKYGLKPNQLVKSTFDNYEIRIQPEEEDEPEEVGVSIDEIHPDTPSEEMKETEQPEPYNQFRITELNHRIQDLYSQLHICTSELKTLMHKG